MKKILLLTLLSPILWALTASAYVPMIREDRVWEYVGRYNHQGEEGFVYHCMKFDGTQEVMGKEYHRFVLFKSTYVNWDADLNKHCRVELKNEPAYLLREEEGKVYALYQNNSLVENYNPENAGATDNLSEFKLYDFTLSDGDTWEYPFHTGEIYDIRPYTVRVQSPVNIAGEECRVMRMEYPNDPDFEIPIDFIEGIGINLNGSMASFCLGFITGDGNSYSAPGPWAEINRVLDADGNVVYGDGQAPPSNDWAFREDWVWKYTDELYDNSVDTEKSCREYEMCFDGVTVIDDITWHNFKKTKSVEFRYKWDHDANEWSLISSKDVECGETFLIREEEGKYFMRLPEGDNLGYNYESWWHMDEPEALLYNFNCSEGESFMTIGESGGAETLEVKTVSSIQIDGQELKVFNANTDYAYPIVEGIGYVKNGILPYGKFSFPVGSSATGPNLVAIEDLEGNVVFEPEMIGIGNGVDGIAATASLYIRQEGNVVSAASDGDAVVTLEVIGVDGAKRAAVAGRGEAVADLTQLAPGVYVVRATNGHDVKTMKLRK